MNFKKIWQGILKALGFLKQETHDILVGVDKFVDAVKKLEESATGQVIIKIAENYLPKGLSSGLSLFLPQAFKALNWAIDATDGKNDDEIIAEGIKYLQSITDPKVKALQLGAFNALVSNWTAENQGLELTIQQAQVANQVIHDTSVLPTKNQA